jgi:hypothetical protein
MKYNIFNFEASSWATHNTAAWLKVIVQGSWNFNYIKNEHLSNLETASRQPTALSTSSNLNFDIRNKLEIYDSRMCVHSTRRKKVSLKKSYPNFKNFITLCSPLHFAYWWQQKSYLPELCEELPAGAT